VTHHEQITPRIPGACNSLLQAAGKFVLEQRELAYLGLTIGA
jgi:hypothetical protein